MEAILRINRNVLTKDVESVELYIAGPFWYDEGFGGVEWNLHDIYDTVEDALVGAKAIGARIVDTQYPNNLLRSVLES